MQQCIGKIGGTLGTFLGDFPVVGIGTSHIVELEN